MLESLAVDISTRKGITSTKPCYNIYIYIYTGVFHFATEMYHITSSLLSSRRLINRQSLSIFNIKLDILKWLCSYCIIPLLEISGLGRKRFQTLIFPTKEVRGIAFADSHKITSSGMSHFCGLFASSCAWAGTASVRARVFQPAIIATEKPTYSRTFSDLSLVPVDDSLQ